MVEGEMDASKADREIEGEEDVDEVVLVVVFASVPPSAIID